MRIIIAGDGKVGHTLAQQLSITKHDVVVIDNNAEALRRADESLDVLGVKGSCGSVSTLKEAGVADTDLLLAVTSRDELNMICCLLGRRLGAKHTIARIRDPEYREGLSIFQKELNLDMIINPEWNAAQEIARVLRFPQANNVELFAGGRIEMLDFRVRESDNLAGRPLFEIARRLPPEVLFAAISRDGQVTIPGGDTVLEIDDVVYILGKTTSTTAFFRKLGRGLAPIQTAMIIGGGLVALYLARLLEKGRIEVKIIEKDKERAHLLDEELNATIIVGDGTDQQLLQSEEIDEVDAFVAVTGQDEENLLSAIYAKDCGVDKVVAKINRANYAGLIRRMGIDSVISPKELAANQILRFVRAMENSGESSIERLYRIVDGQAEALEFYAHKDCRLVGTPLRDLPLRRGMLLGALVRGNKVIIPRGDTTVEENDRVIAIAPGQTVSGLGDLLERGR